MKKILITTGPTNEYIDEVMKITNMSTGRVGIELSRKFLGEGYEVTLICTRSVVRSGLYERYKLSEEKNLKTVQIETTQDMYDALEAESGKKYDLIIHASAVGDYKPEFSFRMEDMANEILLSIKDGASYEKILNVLTNPNCKVKDDSKISSYEPHLTVKLTLTTKLISKLKGWFPSSLLIGFKLLENVEKEFLFDVAKKLCIKNNMDFIIANDLADLRQGEHLSFLVDNNGYKGVTFHSPTDIFEVVNEMIKDK